MKGDIFFALPQASSEAKQTGDLKMCADRLIRFRDQLLEQDISDLYSGRIVALRVPNFYSTEMSEKLAEKMRQSPLFGTYVNAPLIGRVGQAFFEASVSNDSLKNYHHMATTWISEMRSYCDPFLSPIDKLRLKLDDLWANGSSVAIHAGKKMFVGLARVFRGAGIAEPHQDVLAWDAPESRDADDLIGQLAANIYLTMPDRGGELLIWPISMSRDEYQNIKIPGSYGVMADKINASPLRIRPSVGELILFNARMIHAVEASEGGDRITWSCFIGLKQSNNSLMLWS